MLEGDEDAVQGWEKDEEESAGEESVEESVDFALAMALVCVCEYLQTYWLVQKHRILFL